MKLFTILDHKTQFFHKPFASRSIPDALRDWEMVANDSESMISKFPNDYRLYQIADFDLNSGKLTVLEDRLDLGSAADAKKPAQPGPGTLL